jgi:tetratricopeptide (TPR) repeat protein
MTQERQFDNVNDYIADLKQKYQTNNTCANTAYNLGVAYIAKRDFMEAERWLRKALDHSDKFAEAWVQLGGIAMQRGDLEGCLNYNVEASKIRPFFAVPWGNIGFVQAQMGQNDEAVKSLKKALKYDPNFVQAMATMGTLHFMKGEYDECLKVCAKAVDLQPNFGPAYNNMALAYMETGDFAKAVEMVDKALATGYEVAPEVLKELEPHRA